MVKFEMISCTKIIEHGGTLFKSVRAVGFSEKKPSYWESVSFHSEMFDVTNCGLVLRICIINAMIFIKNKHWETCPGSVFYKLLMIINGMILAISHS